MPSGLSSVQKWYIYIAYDIATLAISHGCLKCCIEKDHDVLFRLIDNRGLLEMLTLGVGRAEW